MNYCYLWKFLLELFLNNISKREKGIFIKRIIYKGLYCLILLLSEF